MILLDTHVLLWLAIEPKRLSKGAAQSIRRAVPAGGLGVASITLLEVAALFARGRVRSAGTVLQAVSELLEATGVQVCEITPEIAAAAVQFGTGVPADPADRLIIATALDRSAPLVTRDERIRDSGVCRTVW